MAKCLTYQTGNHFEWLLAISLAISLCSYAEYTRYVEIFQPQSQQAEWVLSGQNGADDETISYDQFIAPEFSQKPVKRSREYETHVQAIHQSQSKVAMETILERSASYPLPVFYQQTTTVLHSGEESSSDISG